MLSYNKEHTVLIVSGDSVISFKVAKYNGDNEKGVSSFIFDEFSWNNVWYGRRDIWGVIVLINCSSSRKS